MATKQRSAPSAPDLFQEFLAGAPHYAAQLRGKDAVYMGPCVVQCPGAWSRCGPTWLVPVGGTAVWGVVGPGVLRWGTTEGLAQLTVGGAKPTWHSVGFAWSPLPNLAFAMTAAALQEGPMEAVARLASSADRWIKDGRP